MKVMAVGNWGEEKIGDRNARRWEMMKLAAMTVLKKSVTWSVRGSWGCLGLGGGGCGGLVYLSLENSCLNLVGVGGVVVCDDVINYWLPAV